MADLTSVNTTITMDENKSVTANFVINTYMITAMAGANGAISPSDAMMVEYGATPTYTITPATGYHVTDVVAWDVVH